VGVCRGVKGGPADGVHDGGEGDGPTFGSVRVVAGQRGIGRWEGGSGCAVGLARDTSKQWPRLSLGPWSISHMVVSIEPG
jgi:hypothetical protein